MKFFQILLIYFSTLSTSLAVDNYCLIYSFPFSPKEWKTRAVPDNLYSDSDTQEIKTFYQVQPTRIFYAINELNNKVFIKLDKQEAQRLVGYGYTLDNKSTPYLTRGLYNHPQGQLYMYWHPKTKSVRETFVGLRSRPPTDQELLFLPMVINLPDEPKNLYISLVGVK